MPGPPESHPVPRGGPPRFDLVRSSVGPRGWLFVVWMPVASLLAIGLGGGFVVLLNSMALVERSWLGWVALLVVPLLWFVLVRAYSQVLLPPAVLVIEPDAVRVLTAKGGEVVGLQRPSLVVRCARSSRHGKWWTNYYAALVLSDGRTSVVIHANTPAAEDRSFGDEAPDLTTYETSRAALSEILAALRASTPGGGAMPTASSSN